ncbi:histidine phosphatase family protein [Zavarzinella formosa]|uniref:histidine phosphatase family protein n=1 Tax=Zavarzinella formosa TaxID=360055 RepID=UPI0002D974D0
MRSTFPVIQLARHGETAWALSGRHTGLTDIPLTERGEAGARLLGKRLQQGTYKAVLTSPLQRAKKTCELAGFGDVAVVDPDLVEWNYGDYEGLIGDQIRQIQPGWNVFVNGCPNGESVADVTARADRVVARLRAVGDDVLVFSSGHFLRALTARWCGLDVSFGRFLLLGTATLSLLGYDHGTEEPVVRLWNDGHHLGD